MNYLEAVPAVRRIDTDRDDLFAIDVVGHVAGADAENLFGLLEAAYALHPKIDVLVRLIDHDGVDWVDVSDETLEQGTAHAVEHVGRCAAVGEPNWVPEAQSLLSASSPVELRHFEAEDEASAWAWLGAKPLAPR
ncbi:STAS/SEC14 domain-containing protein [Mesorhizobium sp.]|uniref:STAS/SEC14 domain-containing protein n=1 Tax=Mesorhizobium sp. TaxID=1871066 RepID=UPI001226AB3A|nr:STAS/SEC14 domain-containing protein [Mesorhizobium sp.]TIT01231.1 MAG: STAS/SEC14 domain-containing protein [Mesorhizobium sp.]